MDKCRREDRGCRLDELPHARHPFQILGQVERYRGGRGPATRMVECLA